MNLTVLIDLDDTLLGTNEASFVPAYINALASKIHGVDAEVFGKQLLKATLGMIQKDTIFNTLEESFDAQFYKAIGIPKVEIIVDIHRFYTEDFGKLQSLTDTRPAASTLVESAFAAGHNVVIATSPFFPRIATLQRLAWAGLPLEKYPFGLVSTYENFHFAKPNLAYYTEVLAQLGWPKQPAVMIGNHAEYDILPAEALGMPTFLVEGSDNYPIQDMHPLSETGSLDDAIPWLQTVSQENFQNDFSSIPGMLAVLKSTPAALQTLTQDLKPELWTKRIIESEWAINEIMCHLRDVDGEVNLPRVQRVLSEADAFLPGIETDTWADEMNYRQQNGPIALQDFLKYRGQLLDHLSQISEETWQKTLRHAIFGPTTFQELIGFITTHDRDHVTQIKNTLIQLNTGV